SINWGDGSTSTGTISVSGSTFTVKGTHTYASAVGSPFTITTTISHDTASNATTMSTATVTSAAAPVVAAPANTTAVEGITQFFAVGSFSDPDGGPWNVDINWGDGSAHTAVNGLAAPGAIPNQTHNYTEEGSYTVTVTVTDTFDNQMGSGTFQI